MNWVDTSASIAFAICLAGALYAYVAYPALLAFFAWSFGRRVQSHLVHEERLPTVSLLIAAHDEEAVIEERIQNALVMDYPPDRREIVVASDGSSDGTAEIVRRYADRGVRLLDYGERRGKAAVINSAIPQLRGEIVLMSDANTMIDAAAARRLVRWLQDPAVGVVVGRLVLTDPRTGRNVDGLYWKYETCLKRCEAKLGALLGANGAIYAIRKDLYVPIPDDTIVDDFVIPLLAKLRTGCAIVYDTEAIAREETPPDIGSEFRRRSRIGAGGFQSIGLLWRLLDPRRGWISLVFFSHKVLRWLCPFFLVGMLVANSFLMDRLLFQITLAAQGVFYAASAAGALLPGSGAASRLFRLTTLFSGMNLALLVGFWRWLSRQQRGVWQRTAR